MAGKGRSERNGVLRSIGLTVGLISAATLLRFVLARPLEGRAPFAFFILAVFFVELYVGWQYAVVAAIAGVFLGLLFVPPVGDVWPVRSEDVISLSFYLGVSFIAIAILEDRKRAIRRAERQLYELQEAREQVTRSESRLQLAISGTPLVAFTQDKDLKYTWFANLPEPEKSDAIGKTDHDFLPSDEADHLTAIKRKVLESGAGSRHEVRVTFNGKQRFVDMIVEPLCGPDGAVEGVGGVSLDITDRKLTEQALATSEMLAQKRLGELEALYNHAPVGLCFLDAELKFIRINNLLAEWTGTSEKDVVGRPAEEILGGSKPFMAPLQKTFETQKPTRVNELQVEHPESGRKMTFSAYFDPVFDVQGEFLGVNLLVQDITELQAAERSQRLLAEATHTLASSLDYKLTLNRLAEAVVPDFADWCGVDVLEENDEVVRVAVAHVNPEKVKWAQELQDKYPPDLEATTGVPQVLKTGKSELYETIPLELLDAAAIDDEHREIIRSIGFHSAMVVPLVARGKVFGAITLVNAESKRSYTQADLALAEELGRRAGIAVDNARLYQAAQREIEERRKAEQQVHQLVGELEARVKQRTEALQAAVEDLEGFCYSVSHDLRQPMRSLSANSRILLEDYGKSLDPEARRHLERISLAGSKMGELVDDLLQFSRLGRTQLAWQEVNLSALSDNLAEQVKQHYPDWHGKILVQSGLQGRGDESMLSIALQNLIENAVKYSSKVEEPRVEVGRNGESFYVRDNGIGFDMQYAHKIYLPFERLHRDDEYPGTGIGLANTRRIIMRHGGRLWAESKPGEGATFFFTLGNPDSAPIVPTGITSYLTLS